MTSGADREAGKQLIAAKQVIEQNKLREHTSADVAAYMSVKKADAERQAAAAQCQARLRLAEGDAQAATKRAEGDRAVKMVDVTIGPSLSGAALDGAAASRDGEVQSEILSTLRQILDRLPAAEPKAGMPQGL